VRTLTLGVDDTDRYMYLQQGAAPNLRRGASTVCVGRAAKHGCPSTPCRYVWGTLTPSDELLP